MSPKASIHAQGRAAVRPMALPFLVSFGALMLFGGCASPQARIGRVATPEIGGPYLEFTYLDADGRPHRLGEHLGDFTLLAFTRCQDEMHGPVAEKLADLVRVSQDPGLASSVGFDIHWSDSGCPEQNQCHAISKNQFLFSICDARGATRQMYGVGAEDQFFVIGPDGRIWDRAPASQFDTLETKYRAFFRNYAIEKRQQLPEG